MKVCQNCGTEHDEQVVFCTKCSCKITEKRSSKKLIWIISFIAVFLVAFCFKHYSFSKSYNNCKMLAAVKFEGKYGYIDPSGKFVIPPKYKYAGSFSCRRAIVQGIIDSDYGVIDYDGNILQGVNYPIIESFRCGYAKAYITSSGIPLECILTKNADTYIWKDTREYIYIDVNGNKVFKNKIFGGNKGEHVKIIDRDLIQIRVRGKRPIVTDFGMNFKFELPFLYSEASYLKDGLIEVDSLVTLEEVLAGSDRVIYMDRKGTAVIDTSMNKRLRNKRWDPSDFSDGLAVLGYPIGCGKTFNLTSQTCVIDKNGKIVKMLNVDIVKPFCGGYTTFLRRDTNSGIIDKNCNLVLSLPYKDIGNMSKCGLVAVKNDNGKWGYIDINGKVIIDFKFEDACQFCDAYDRGYEEPLNIVGL